MNLCLIIMVVRQMEVDYDHRQRKVIYSERAIMESEHLAS